MRLAKELHTLRMFLLFGIVEVSLMANFLPAGVLVAVGAWLCFLLLVIVYLFDITYHAIRSKN